MFSPMTCARLPICTQRTWRVALAGTPALSACCTDQTCRRYCHLEKGTERCARICSWS